MFLIKTKTNKPIKTRGQKKQKKLKKKREYLLSVLLTYLIESWISPGCSYEFNVAYVQREKSQYLLYYNNVWSTHFQGQK